MTLTVAYAPDERGKTALHLASMLARSIGDELVVCSVIPAPWVPGMARIDAEYRKELDEIADQALALARKNLPGDVSARFERHSARSAPAGLLEVAKQYDGIHDRGRYVVGRRVRAYLARQCHQPAAAQLAGRHRPGAARVPEPAGGEGEAGDRGVRRVGERGEPRCLPRPGWRHGSALRCGSRRSRCGRAPHIRPGSAPTPRTWCCRSGSLTSRRARTPHSSRSRSWRRCHGKWRPWSDTARAGGGDRRRRLGRRRRAGGRLEPSRPDRAGVSRVQGAKILRSSPVPVVVVPHGQAEELANG